MNTYTISQIVLHGFGTLAIGSPPQPVLPVGARPSRTVRRVLERNGPEVECREFRCARCAAWTRTEGSEPRCECCGGALTPDGNAR